MDETSRITWETETESCILLCWYGEMADAEDSKSSAARHGGSSPSTSTNLNGTLDQLEGVVPFRPGNVQVRVL